MSSPRKRIKLTPKKQKNYMEYTQESKVTSTPQRQNATVGSPNISTISSIRSSVKTSLFDTFNEDNLSESINAKAATSSSRSSSSLSVARSGKSEILAVEDYDTYINEFPPRIQYTGRIWKMYRPLQDNTLYAQILQNPQNVQEVVTELLLEYNRKPESVICILIQLCIDVCGFQNFKVADHYNLQDDIAERIIEKMGSDEILVEQEILINMGKYLLMENATSLAKVLKISINNFLQKLIICTHERGILYDNFFAKHFFVFIKCMAFSKICSIRHTGVIFGIKILTAVLMIYKKIVNEENLSSHLSENVQLQKQEIDNYLEYFYLIFFKNCRLQERRTVLMRVECIYEMNIWVRYFPKIFITQLQTVNYLLKLITDSSKDVRFAALETFKTFLETADILTLMKSAVPDFAEHIGKRFYDVDIKVAVKAIDIYRILLKRDSSLITTKRFEMLMNLVFDKYFPIGEAASRYLISFLEKTEDNEEILLLQLAKFSMKPGDAVKQLLVEGCLNYCPVIKNWKLYISILLRDDVELDIKEPLVELFAEAVHQVLIGRSAKPRDKSRRVNNINPTEHRKVAKYFLKLVTLLKKYEDHPQILIELLKIFNTVDNEVLSDTSADTAKNICSLMGNLFYFHTDKTLLKKLSETLRYFSDTTHGNYVPNIIEDISSKYTNDLMANLTDGKRDTIDTVLKISVLFADFDLTMKLKWETLFDTWGEVVEAITTSLLSCCKWYLIWSLRAIPNATNHITQFPELTRLCGEFTSTCFNMLHHLKGDLLHFKTYECLCNFHIKYMTDLDELKKSAKQMEQLKLVIEDKQLQKVFVSFLEKYVIHNTTMPLFERRSYVVKFIDLCHINVLPVMCLGHIFRYYYMYNKEYAPMIESSLSAMAKKDEDTFLMMVIYTLTISYEQITKKYNAVDLTTQEVKDLKFLIKQFLNFKELKTPNKKLTKLIYFAINYSVKDTSKYAFLYFVKYFVNLIILDTDRTEVLNFLREKVPKTAEKNDAVLSLANCLKNSKLGTSNKPKTRNISKQTQENIKPKKKPEAPRRMGRRKSSGKKANVTKAKSTQKKARKGRNVDTETDVSGDLTIHDSESDDLEESFSKLKCN